MQKSITTHSIFSLFSTFHINENEQWRNCHFLVGLGSVGDDYSDYSLCICICVYFYVFAIMYVFSINSFFLRSPQNPPSLKPTTYDSTYVHLYFTYISPLSQTTKQPQTPGGLPPPNGWGAGNDSPCSGPWPRPFVKRWVASPRPGGEPRGETCACTSSDGLGGAEQPDVGKSLGEIRWPVDWRPVNRPVPPRNSRPKLKKEAY